VRPRSSRWSKVGGLTLIERTLLTLRRAGIREFRIVRARIAIASSPRPRREAPALARHHLRRMRGLAARQRGVARAGRRRRGPFLVSMADHVSDGASARALVAASVARPGTPKLATDPRRGRV
jgi:hypothetical protein